MLTLRHIEIVGALAQHRHFGRAAEALGITQSALTRALQALETDLGVRLFDRGTGIPEPTMFGRIVLEWGQPVVRSMDNLTREIRLARGLEIGEVTVSAGTFPSELWVPRTLGRLAMEFPNVRCRMRSCESRRAVKDVLNGSSDIAVADLVEVRGLDELAFDRLVTVKVALFCRPGHPLLKHRVIKEIDLADFPLAGPRPSHYASEVMDNAGENRALTVPKSGGFVPRLWVESFTAMRQVVSASDAISWAPVPLLDPFWKAGELAPLVMRPAPIDVEFGLIYPRYRTPTPAVMAFIKIIRAIAGNKPVPPATA
ncbi:LysR family transcriptional regulator [Phreatobacter stygius]|uniref:LysR family transcriptional regulator n=1 Tax=Phreatobacter stygius TaxID=1940610 RepID=A0A4D7BAA8_9HYPH|nr:LysR family transcriptional regulator [Phreatobacter stygius]QCI67078.1 LysR family transcriptional regulator [Phreatobacter stygius]